MRTIAIDLSVVEKNMAGVGYYASEATKSILNMDKENNYLLYTFDKDRLGDFINYKNAEIVEIKDKTNHFKWILKTVSDIKSKKVDLLVSYSLFMFGVLFPNTIQIIHDIIPVKHAEFWTRSASIKFKYQLLLASKRTKIFATNSQTTLDDLNHYFPATLGKSFYVGGGINKWVFTQISEKTKVNVKKRYSLPDHYLLSIGTIQPRKNYKTTIKAFSKVANKYPDIHYVIGGGKGWLYEDIFAEVKLLGLEGRVHFLGYVDEEEMPSLYSLASGFVATSLYEGFVLPSLEAYYFGLPTLTSDIKIMREGMKDMVQYADPKSIDDIALGLETIINSEKFIPNKEFLNIYSWEKVGSRILDLYDKI